MIEIVDGSGTKKNNNQKSVTTPISDDLRKDLNTDADLEKRKKGAEEFGKFTDEFEKIIVNTDLIDDADRRENTREAIYDLVIPRDVIMGIQALFLGEKPVMRQIFSKDSKVNSSQRKEVYELFEKFGFKIIPDTLGEVFVCNPKYMQEIIKKYPEVYGDIDYKEAIKSNHKEMNDMRLGLLLGYPKDACEGFQKYISHKYSTDINDQNIASQMRDESEKSRQYRKSTYGMTFRDYGAGEETKTLRERLRRAFQESGILQVRDPITK